MLLIQLCFKNIFVYFKSWWISCISNSWKHLNDEFRRTLFSVIEHFLNINFVLSVTFQLFPNKVIVAITYKLIVTIERHFNRNFDYILNIKQIIYFYYFSIGDIYTCSVQRWW